VFSDVQAAGLFAALLRKFFINHKGWMSWRRLAAIYERRLCMKSVLKLLCLLMAVLAVIGLTVPAYAALSQGPSPAVLRPVLSVCLVLATGFVVKSASAAFTKRHTAATGV
jgi:hypothetical protein